MITIKKHGEPTPGVCLKPFIEVPTLKRPMKAPTDPITNHELTLIKYPVVGSPKLDGFRCCVTDKAHTSSMKLIENRFTQKILSSMPDLQGKDGELIVGPPRRMFEDDDVFERTSGALRRREGEPDFKIYLFDDFRYKWMPYDGRWLAQMNATWTHYYDRVVIVEQRLLYSPEEVMAYEDEKVEEGYEGAMIRSLKGLYKEGRTTLREGTIFKRKPFDEATCVIVGFVEEMENQNPQVENEMGQMKRSHHKENMVPKNTLGAFILRSPLWKDSFRCGGGSEDENKKIWDNRENYLGRLMDMKYQKYGSIDKPRLPGVGKNGIRFRDPWDLDIELVEALHKEFAKGA